MNVGFNGSTARRPWLSWVPEASLTLCRTLQWVHGPKTVVIMCISFQLVSFRRLQWVHGPKTVVIVGAVKALEAPVPASMGPRPEDRGYQQMDRNQNMLYWLQWVHGPKTVVIQALTGLSWPEVAASMGPRPEDRGYHST